MALDLDRIFGGLDLSRRRSLTIAVSGGSDSLALLLLLKSFIDRRAPDVSVLAVTVDHAMRPEAAAEARAVATLCQQIGVEHRTMVWTGTKPEKGLIAAAREARYRLLAQAADDVGADTILVAHTMDDQAETVAMRARRGEGLGLAGMARATLYDERIWLVRPLLQVRRQALRDHLAAAGIHWIDDPTNDNRRYERVRVRSALEDNDVRALADQAARAGKARAELGRQAATLIARFVTMPARGLFRLDPAMFDGSDAATHALRIVLAVAGGTPRLPDHDRATTLACRLAAGPLRVALSRALVDARKSGVWIRREHRNLPVTQLSATQTLWDGRWRIAVKDEAMGLQVGACRQARPTADAASRSDIPESLVRAAFSAEPCIFRDGRLIGAADTDDARALGISAWPVEALFAHFLPEFDLALAQALRCVLARPALPVSPWKNHIDADA
ncbi:MAG: tRNA lysidine(34) synthetase TilS [Aquamicrobium sp.]|nr:tRNA lysidine(34) synthetase TilS [Aquamicrobium sp.]